MKGDIYRPQVARKKDELTGVNVTQLTDDCGDSHHPYFTQILIDKNNEFMICHSTHNGTVTGQFYTINLKTGKMVQITDDDNIVGCSACLDAEKNIVYYMNGRELKSVRLDTLETETHLEIPRGFETGILSITNDGRYIGFGYTETLETITQSGTLYSAMREKQFRRGTSVVVRYDTHERKAYAVWGENNWISHINISPVDENIIMFNHEGNWHLVQRLWIAKVNTDEVYPIVKQKINYERVGHEFFLSNGRIGAQYTMRQNLDTHFFRDAMFGDVFVDPDGGNKEIYFYPYTRPMHVQMNHAMTMGAGDGAHIRRDMPDNRKYIGLNKYENNRIKVGLLCRHNSTFKAQSSHPHCIFTRDDKQVIFSSDFGSGHSNIYLVDADYDKCIFE